MAVFLNPKNDMHKLFNTFFSSIIICNPSINYTDLSNNV